MVACGDFTEGGKQLIEFAKLKNTCIDSELNGYGTELSTILDAIEEQTLLPPKVLREFFWDQFIADAFLGNFDRTMATGVCWWMRIWARRSWRRSTTAVPACTLS